MKNNYELNEQKSLLDLCKSSNFEEASLLLKGHLSIADINAADTIITGKTPLIYAIEADKYEIVKKLLNKKADINIVDNDGFSALTHAINNGNKNIVSKLLKKDAYIREQDFKILKSLKQSNSSFATEIESMVQNKISNNSTILYNAITQGNEAEVERICKQGFNKDYHYHQDYHYRLKNEFGENVDSFESPNLMELAIRSGKAEIVTTLINHGLNCNKPYGFSEYYSPLVYAAHFYKPKIVEALLNRDDINLVSRVFDFAQANPELELMLFKKLQNKSTSERGLNEIEAKHFNQYMKNALNDIYKEVKKEARSKDNNIDNINLKIQGYFTLDDSKKNTCKELVTKLFKEIHDSKSKDPEPIKGLAEALMKFFDNLLKLICGDSIEKESFKKFEMEIKAKILSPDKQKVNKQATANPPNEKNNKNNSKGI